MEQQEIVKGASLWQDAWKRLLKNKLAVFGLLATEKWRLSPRSNFRNGRNDKVKND